MLERILARPIIRACLLMVGLAAVSACSSGDGGSGTAYSNNYKGTYATDDSTLRLAGQTVSFTMNWNESNGTVTGIYLDDHFAPKGVTLSGTVANGVYQFTVPLNEAVDGVESLVFDILTVDGALVASAQGKGANGSVVFASANIALESTGSGTGGHTKPSDVAGFFSQVAGTYTWTAKRTGKGDSTFTAGKQYTVTITTDKKVSFPKDDGTTFSFTYGEDPTDSFEAYDHEAYIIVKRGDVKVLVQHQFEENEKVMSYEIGSGTDGTFWAFSDDTATPAESGNLGVLGASEAVGEFTATISTVTGATPHSFAVGDEVSFAVDEDGNITGDFGEFSYGEETFVHMLAIKDGVEEHQMNWFSPNKTVTTKNQVQLYLKDGTFTKILFTIEKNGVGTYHYATLKK